MNFTYKEVEKNGKAVVKVIAGKWYIITKCGELGFVAKEINSMQTRYLRNTEGIRTDSLYFDFIEKCCKLGIKEAKIEVLFQSENGYEVLKFELETLCSSYGRRYCLNNNSTPYIPKMVTATKSKGSKWLKQNEYLNYMRLLKKHKNEN